MKKLSLVIGLLLMFSSVFAQNEITIQAIKQISVASSVLNGKQDIKASHYRLVEIDMQALRAGLKQAAHQNNRRKKADVWLQLPMPNGKMMSYRIVENSTMAPGLAAKFPEIKAYDGYGESNTIAKFDLTPKGFHAMIMKPGEPIVFIDPYSATDTRYYMVYNIKDFITKKRMRCEVITPPTQTAIFPLKTKFATPYTNCQLKKYRLALAATYSYTQFTGGTKATALAAEVTTVNRINGIYETDAGITLELISNNEDIICDYTGCPTSPPGPNGVRPYTSGDTEALFAENQVNVTLIIGASNYDIGHVVDAFPATTPDGKVRPSVKTTILKRFRRS